MLRWISAFFLSFLPLVAFTSESFTDPHSKITFDIPSNFSLNEMNSKFDTEDNVWWYQFIDPNGSILTIEIDYYEESKTLPEHFHRTLTGDDDSEEEIIFEGLEFKNFKLNGIDFTKCKVRALANSNAILEPLYIADYLFVKGSFGFSIGLMKSTDDTLPDDTLDEFMQNILNSIHFK